MFGKVHYHGRGNMQILVASNDVTFLLYENEEYLSNVRFSSKLEGSSGRIFHKYTIIKFVSALDMKTTIFLRKVTITNVWETSIFKCCQPQIESSSIKFVNDWKLHDMGNNNIRTLTGPGFSNIS